MEIDPWLPGAWGLCLKETTCMNKAIERLELQAHEAIDRHADKNFWEDILEVCQAARMYELVKSLPANGAVLEHRFDNYEKKEMWIIWKSGSALHDEGFTGDTLDEALLAWQKAQGGE